MPKTRPKARWIALGALALAALAFTPVTWLHVSTADHRDALADAPARPVAIVLGAGLTPDGRPTPSLARRLDIAAELYRSGRVEAILATGDNSLDSYNETDAMRGHLIEAGVPEAKAAGDYAGFSTWDSCVRAREVFGVEKATVVTQSFHLPRAVALCRAAGIEAGGVGDPGWGEERLVANVYGYTREVPAAFKAVTEAVLQPEPRFLGDHETTVQRALETPRRE
ncbi:vancomycin permeability regulator SanA [Spinactinospora alkalitolerans]|uniref:Vancomycin permeability regulator SanA n=1 Tax=Spinactinospora alkalitolerans TaxID=687207 RepID=A0A852U2Z9_9ACTN|nr:ElyC/SanA/YdcF family protein [Spinactinospora alkalitolerans]NYE49303.1 vancomycin permeability regulator SanA [Spinactinospora alkalitolerans]